MMPNHTSARAVLMLVGFFTFLVALTFNTLSGFGDRTGIFTQSTEDVLLRYTTPFTPALWTFFVWDFIYFWVLAMFLYFVSGLCRRTAYDWMYTTPAALPYGFHISLLANLCLNITFLFLFDREVLFSVMFTSGLMTVTDYTLLIFSCHGLKIYGAWLYKYHRIDLWLYRILVQNGVALYATWGTLSTLLNLTIYLQHQKGASRCDCATVSQLLLLMILFVWFLFENFYFDEHVRYIFTIYPVIMLWLSGNIDNLDPRTHNFFFGVIILIICCLLFLARVILVSWRHHKRPLYSESEPTMTPGHVLLHAGSVILAIVTQVCSVVFFWLAKDSNIPNAVFETSAGNVSETWSLEVTMDRWAHNNWLMIDSWSLAWLVEAVYRLCKRNVFGPEACNPELHTPLFYLMWACVNSARISCLLLWDRLEIVAAFTMSAIQPSISFYMLYTSYYNLNMHKVWLAINNRNVIWWMRYLTQSGLALFAWWTLQIAAVNFGIVLKYKAGVQDPVASTIVLTTILLSAVIWFFLQSVVYLKYMRYTFTVYPILILGLGAMFTRSFQVSNISTNTVYCGFMMLLITILCSMHLIAACMFKSSIHKPQLQPGLTLENCAVIYQPEGKGNMKIHK
ncbi:hypothetical protein WMY93_030183 [Mugilogobius chulae]|uniref:Uncharacterized protein n=1 Tax=Mugilogobius chulae TaxID=88201 RepID=A0AAW0MV91_9GOBI